MQQACYCGRVGEIEDQQPILLDARGERALRCTGCGYIDRLLWLSEDARELVFEEAERRRSGRRGSSVVA
jgi:hypothetical protein